MTASKTVILGRFVYQADVLPKRARTPRRVNLWAPAEFAIATIRTDDLARDVIRILPRIDIAGHEDGRPLSFDAHAGELWTPMVAPTADGGRRRADNPTPAATVDQYVGSFNNPFPNYLGGCDNPILAAGDSDLSPTSPRDHLPASEADFAGTILWSNRGDMLRRHETAARDILFVGDHVFVRRPEPTWTVCRTTFFSGALRNSHGGIALTGLPPRTDQQRFRLDRLDAAVEWRDKEDPTIPDGIYGDIVHADFSLLKRDDLACMVGDDMPPILHGQGTSALPHISDAGLASWRALSRALREIPRWNLRDDRIPLTTPEAIHHLRTIKNDLQLPTIPSYARPQIEQTLKYMDPILRRAEFEAAHAPRLADNDVTALSAFGATP